MKQGDIVLLTVYYTDQSSSKIRPGVIISNNHINNTNDDLVVVPVTSTIKDLPYSVLIRQEDLASGELIVPGRIRVDKPLTAHKSIIKKKIGTLRREALCSVKNELCKVFE